MIIKNNLDKRLKIQYVDIGATKSWGFPVNTEHQAKFSAFFSGIFETKSADEFDLILVDGRFRVACVLAILLSRKTNLSDLTILVHYYSIRDAYKFIEKYLEVLDSADPLYSFKIRTGIDYDQLKSDYNHFKYVPE